MKFKPEYKSGNFKCPHCQVNAQQKWFDHDASSDVVNQILNDAFYTYRSKVQEYEQRAIRGFVNIAERANIDMLQEYIPTNFAVATCQSCNDISLWINREIVYPRKSSIDPPNEDMDADIKDIYREAAIIFIDSPKGSTALLRLVLQKLLKQIGKSGKDINSDIKELVSDGLSPKIQQALDLVRVVGNNAVHPGQIDLNDDADIALKLFHLVNFIASELITKPKELDSLYSEIIPDETKEHINQRDKKK